MKYLDNKSYYQKLGTHPNTQGNLQFDLNEPTISHLFRFQTAALHDRTYGQAFFDVLKERNYISLDEKINILEVGGGVGDFALSFISRLEENSIKFNYSIADISPYLQTQQKLKLINKEVTFIEADATELPIPDESIDLLISNEVIADFDAILLSPHEYLTFQDEFVRVVRTLADNNYLPAEVCAESDEESILVNIGTLKFINEIARVLKFQGSAIITEFGINGNGRIANIGTPNNIHHEYAINFQHLSHYAKYKGFLTGIEPLIDFLGFDKDVRMTNLNDIQALQNLSASLNDAQALQNLTKDEIPIAAIERSYIAQHLDIELLESYGFKFPKIGESDFPCDNTMPFAKSFKSFTCKKLFKSAHFKPINAISNLM